MPSMVVAGHRLKVAGCTSPLEAREGRQAAFHALRSSSGQRSSGKERTLPFDGRTSCDAVVGGLMRYERDRI